MSDNELRESLKIIHDLEKEITEQASVAYLYILKMETLKYFVSLTTEKEFKLWRQIEYLKEQLKLDADLDLDLLRLYRNRIIHSVYVVREDVLTGNYLEEMIAYVNEFYNLLLTHYRYNRDGTKINNKNTCNEKPKLIITEDIDEN